MKKIYNICRSMLLLAAVSIAMPSCEKLEDLNVNPNKIVLGETTPDAILQDLINSGTWTLLYRSWRINSDLMQYSMQSDGLEKISCFVLKSSDSQTLWYNLSGSCRSAVHMASLAVEQNDANSEAIALTLKAFYVSAMTDLFGDMPYSQAFRIITDNISQPVYDEQSEIYAALCADLRRADTLYDTSAEYKGASYDLLYNGDLTKWQKFTNALRLRLLMRQSKQVDVSEEMTDIVANRPIFTSNADGAILRYTGISPFFNGFGPSGSLAYPAMSQNKRMCSRLIDLLAVCDDPRLEKFAEQVKVDGEMVYAGMLSGQSDDYINAHKGVTSNFAKALSSDTQPTTLLSFAEQEFILAEASIRGFIAGDAANYYNTGVRASITEWCGDEAMARADAVLASPRAAYDGTAERIMEQKWVSLFMVGFESWCDYRRTALPTLGFGPACENFDAAGMPQMPTRLCYPIISQTTNRANYQAAVERMGGNDDMLTKVWWANGDRY